MAKLTARDFGEGGREEAWWPRPGVTGRVPRTVCPAGAGATPAGARRGGPRRRAGVAAARPRRGGPCARAARARPALLQRELCARPGARTAPPAPSCRRSRRWARPPGRGSRSRRQLLPASSTSSPPRRLAAGPLVGAPARAARHRRRPLGPRQRPSLAPRPARPARAHTRSPRPHAAPRPPLAMLSFQYPDVYRDETAVSTPARARPAAGRGCRVCRRPQLLSPQPLAPCVRPLPLGLCLRETGRGRRAPPEPRGPWWPTLAACWRRSLGSATVWPPPKINGVKGRRPGRNGRFTELGRQNVSLLFGWRRLLLEYGGRRKCVCVWMM